MQINSGIREEPAVSTPRATEAASEGGYLFKPIFVIAINIVLAGIAISQLGQGFEILLKSSQGAKDLRLRWGEVQYVLAGRNPFDLYFARPTNPSLAAPLWSHRDVSPIPSLGYPDGVAYPGWAYFSGMAFFWPSWPSVRAYWATINLAALALTFWWAFSLGREFGGGAGVLFGLACLDIGANCATLGLGQYGLVIDAFLILSLMCQQRAGHLPEGIFMGVAFTKPNMSGLFALPMLIHRRWSALLWMAGYISIASAVIWIITKTNPFEMGLQWLQATREFGAERNIEVAPLMAMGIKRGAVIRWIGAIDGFGGLVGMYVWRRASPLVQFAIAAVAGRLWTYHRGYDDAMMVFLLIALAAAAFKTRKTWLMVVFLLVGTALWMPAIIYDHRAFENALQLTWLVGLAALLVATPFRPGMAPELDETTSGSNA